MSKNTCNVYQDLITLYVDELCSDDSKKIVEEHLETCQKCQELYGTMSKEMNITLLSNNENMEKEKFKTDLEKTWNKYKKKSFLKILSVCLSLIVILSIGFYMLIFKYYNINKDNVIINDISMLSDKSITCEILTKKGNGWKNSRITPVDNNLYITIQSTVLDQENNSPPYVSYVRIDIDHYENEYNTEIEGVYYGTPEENILIWKEGMAISDARKEIENIFEFMTNN